MAEKIENTFGCTVSNSHNIWTSIIDIIQDEIYRKLRRRIDTKNIYIRNAIGDPDTKPRDDQVIWDENIEYELNCLKSRINPI